MKHCISQAICFSHLTFCITLNFIFGYCFRACLDLKITVYMFCWYLLATWPWRHGWKRYAHKTYYIWCHWKENFMLINICYRTYITPYKNALQKHKMTILNTDNFTLQCFLFADFYFLNLTWDLKVEASRIGNDRFKGSLAI